MSEPLKGTEAAAGTIQRVSYTHDAVIDYIVANPAVKKQDLAKVFGYTNAWLSQVMNSDAFQARLAVRKEDLVDPTIVASIEEKWKGAVDQSLDILAQKLEATGSADLALKVAELGSKALGLGARDRSAVVQNNFVVQMPGKAQTAAEWASAHGPVIEAGE